MSLSLVTARNQYATAMLSAVVLLCLLMSSNVFAVSASNTYFTADSVFATGAQAHNGALSDTALESQISNYYRNVGADAAGGVDWSYAGKQDNGGTKDGAMGISITPNGSGTGFSWSMDDPNDLAGFADAIFIVSNGSEYAFFYFQSMGHTSGFVDTQSIFGANSYTFMSVYTRGASSTGVGSGAAGSGGGASAGVSGGSSGAVSVPEIDASLAPLAAALLFFLIALLRESSYKH